MPAGARAGEPAAATAPSRAAMGRRGIAAPREVDGKVDADGRRLARRTDPRAGGLARRAARAGRRAHGQRAREQQAAPRRARCTIRRGARRRGRRRRARDAPAGAHASSIARRGSAAARAAAAQHQRGHGAEHAGIDRTPARDHGDRPGEQRECRTTQPARWPAALPRGALRAANTTARTYTRVARRAQVPTAESSHRPKLVKATITVSIQYCERTASCALR